MTGTPDDRRWLFDLSGLLERYREWSLFVGRPLNAHDAMHLKQRVREDVERIDRKLGKEKE